jgi:hypothetical protein
LNGKNQGKKHQPMYCMLFTHRLKLIIKSQSSFL